MKIGKSKDNDKEKICKLFSNMSDKFAVGINPPEDTEVKAKLKASRSLMSTKVNKKIINIVDEK